MSYVLAVLAVLISFAALVYVADSPRQLALGLLGAAVVFVLLLIIDPLNR